MAKKGFFKWFWEDIILGFAVAVGLDVVVKAQWPRLLSNLAETLGATMKQKVEGDKRAEMLREFRRMETAGINIDNLKRRHADSVKNQPIPEYLFVELLCKIPPEDPNNPLSIRPPVAPATNGVAQPQNDRQADLKWLNDMSENQFYQMMEFVHHDVITQWCRIGWNWIVLDFAATLAGMGVAGIWILGVLRILWHIIVRLLRWTSGSLFRITIVVIIAAIVFWPLALLVMAIFRASQGRGAANQSGTSQNGMQPRRGVGLFSFIGTMIGVGFLMGIYFKLVPTAVDPELAHAALMAIAATFFFWNVRWLRVSLLLFIAALTVIFFLGGRTAAKYEVKAAWASVATRGNDDAKTIAELQKQLAAKDEAAAGVHKTPKNSSSNGAIMPPKEKKQLTSGGNTNTGEENSLVPLAKPQAPPTPAPPPQQIAEQACPSLPRPIESGNFTFVLTYCGVRGNQVRLSGTIQYYGPEKTNLSFHPFKAYDDAGDIYIVQDGRFGTSKSFGIDHSGQWMYPPTSVPYSTPFSVELGPENENLHPAMALTLVMPCSDELGGQIVLQLPLR
jgi:hypothetical protein